MRPHYHDSTISRPICEVKHGQVWLVLAVGDQLGSPNAAYFFRVFFSVCFLGLEPGAHLSLEIYRLLCGGETAE